MGETVEMFTLCILKMNGARRLIEVAQASNLVEYNCCKFQSIQPVGGISSAMVLTASVELLTPLLYGSVATIPAIKALN